MPVISELCPDTDVFEPVTVTWFEQLAKVIAAVVPSDAIVAPLPLTDAGVPLQVPDADNVPVQVLVTVQVAGVPAVQLAPVPVTVTPDTVPVPAVVTVAVILRIEVQAVLVNEPLDEPLVQSLASLTQAPIGAADS